MVEPPPRSRRATILRVGLELVVNFVLPYAVYSWAAPAWGDVHALLAASVPPILWSLGEFALNRTLDAASILVLAGIALSLLAFVGGGSARLLQLRENLVGGLIGLLFLGSAAIGRPLMYVLAQAGLRRRSATQADEFAALQDRPIFRRTMAVMTVVWGFGLLAQTAVACVLVFSMPIARYLLVSPFVGYGGTGALALWTWWFAKRQRRLRLAAEAVAGAAIGS